MYLPISACCYLGWYRPPIWNLDSPSLDWILPGLCHIHPCHGQDEQVLLCMHEKDKDRMMPQIWGISAEWLSLWLFPHWCPSPWWCWRPCSCSPPMATPLQVRTLFILCLRFACMLSQSLLSFLIFPLNLQFLSHFDNQWFMLSFLAPFWWLQFLLIW